MSNNFWSVKIGDKVEYVGCACGFQLPLNTPFEVVAIKLDWFYFIDQNGKKRGNRMGSPCFVKI